MADQEFVCSNCGEFVSQLTASGFCIKCSPRSAIPTGECIICGKSLYGNHSPLFCSEHRGFRARLQNLRKRMSREEAAAQLKERFSE